MRCLMELCGLRGGPPHLVPLHLVLEVPVPSWNCLLARSERALHVPGVRFHLREDVPLACGICRVRCCARRERWADGPCSPRSPTQWCQCETRRTRLELVCGCSLSSPGYCCSLGTWETSSLSADRYGLESFRWELAIDEDLVNSSAYRYGQESVEKRHGSGGEERRSASSPCAGARRNHWLSGGKAAAAIVQIRWRVLVVWTGHCHQDLHACGYRRTLVAADA
jgi:hypothetical protein